MNKYDLDKLELDVENIRKKRLEVLKRKYQLAKSLGFSSAEARVLQFKSKETIELLSEEKNGKANQRGT